MVAPPVEVQSLIQQQKALAAEHILQGRAERALSCYRQVLELSPRDLPVRYKVAELLAQLGQRREAVREFHSLALRYAAEGQTLPAIAVCQVLLALEPAHREAQETLAGLITPRGTGEPKAPREPTPAPPLRAPLSREVVEALLDNRLLDELLRSHPVFQPLPEANKLALLPHFQCRSVEPGSVLLRQGQYSHALHLLLRGRCGVVHEEEGDERPYPDMTEGAVFGEISLLLELRVSATVRALTPCVLLVLEQDAVKEWVLSHPAARRGLTQLSRERLERTADLLSQGAQVRDPFLR